MRRTPVNHPARQLYSGLGLSIYGIASSFLDLVFPPRCAGCDRVDFRWCPRCQSELLCIPFELYKRELIGMPIVSTGLHSGKLQAAVQALKYEKVMLLMNPLSDRLYNGYKQLHWQPDLIVPIPMHKNRLQQRGYNQAELLATALAEKVGVPCNTQLMTRHRDTPSQVGLTRRQRITNVKGAFQVNTAIPHQSILLIDDVFTTGATIAMCGQALMKAGARQVFGLTVTTAQS